MSWRPGRPGRVYLCEDDKKENLIHARFIDGNKLILKNYCFGSRPGIWAPAESPEPGFCSYDIAHLATSKRNKKKKKIKN